MTACPHKIKQFPGDGCWYCVTELNAILKKDIEEWKVSARDTEVKFLEATERALGYAEMVGTLKRQINLAVSGMAEFRELAHRLEDDKEQAEGRLKSAVAEALGIADGLRHDLGQPTPAKKILAAAYRRERKRREAAEAEIARMKRCIEAAMELQKYLPDAQRREGA